MNSKDQFFELQTVTGQASAPELDGMTNYGVSARLLGLLNAPNRREPFAFQHSSNRPTAYVWQVTDSWMRSGLAA